MSHNVDSSIVSRIAKLLALSKSSNIHEAELALSRANELMTKHQISMAQVNTSPHANGNGNGAVLGEWWRVPDLKMKLHYVEILALAAAKLFDADVLCSGSQLHGTSVYFIGTREDIDLSKSTFLFLYSTWKLEMASDLLLAKSRSPRPFSPADTMKFKQGHGIGFSTTINHRVSELVYSRKAEVSSTPTGKDLVVIKESLVRQFRDSVCGKSRGAKVSSGSSLGYGAGVAAGNRTPLGHK